MSQEIQVVPADRPGREEILQAIDAWNIDARNIDAVDIDARNIDYYARLFAYKSISYTGEINAKRENHAKPVALDGKVEKKESEEEERHECPACGKVHRIRNEVSN